ncbi:hypothetical protein MBLNU459_g7169t1 [Dothideomycetes sp. NU459]
MGLAKGGFLRLFQTFLYALEFCCAGVILGIFSWFLAVLSHNNQHIPTWEKAVEGLSGAACLYLIFAVLLTCFLGGVSFFAFLAIVLDLCFVGAFIAIAVLTRHGANSCRGNVNTPIGSGLASSQIDGHTLRTQCKLNTAAFAVAIIGAFLFFITALMQIALVRNHKKEKRFGPSPANNYTSGTGNRKFWQGRNKRVNDAELGTVAAGGAGAGLGARQHDLRPSHDTAHTDTTAVAAGHNTLQKDSIDGVGLHNGHAPHVVGDQRVGVNPHLDQNGQLPHASHGGYYTAPHGSANPYGYDDTTAPVGTARNF